MFAIKTFFDFELVRCEPLICSHCEAFTRLHKYIEECRVELSKPDYSEMSDTEVVIRLYEIKDELIFPVILGEFTFYKHYGRIPSGGAGFFLGDDSPKEV
jgi:hypothetical protein